MPILAFPDPTRTTPEGLLALGGDLHPESLLLAYRSGIFPWPMEGMPLPWFCPPQRAIFEFSTLHVSRSLRRTRRKTHLIHTIDRAFPEVMRGCAETPRTDLRTGRVSTGTWITPEMFEAYVELHRLGHAHSVETWEGDQLVGGVYGVCADGAFAAESMFRRVPEASKLAVFHLMEHLAARGLDWMDVQVMSPHLAQWGARNISRKEFLKRLAATRKRGIVAFDPSPR